MLWVFPNPKYVPGGLENFWTNIPKDRDIQPSPGMMQSTGGDGAGSIFSGFFCKQENLKERSAGEKEKKCRILFSLLQGADTEDFVYNT